MRILSQEHILSGTLFIVIIVKPNYEMVLRDDGYLRNSFVLEDEYDDAEYPYKIISEL